MSRRPDDQDFLPFLAKPTSPEQLLALEEILDQLNLGEMPPRKKGVAQPPDDKRRKIVDGITQYLLAHSAGEQAGDTMLRRLTRYEHSYTIRDLLQINTEVMDASALFPEEQKRHGFTNVGESQVLSDYQLKLYLEAARDYIEQALVFGKKKPQRKVWNIAPSEFSKKNAGGTKVAYRALDVDGKYVDIGHGEPADRRPNAPSSLMKGGLPASGTYRIRVTAEGVGRLDHGYDPKILGIDTSQPIKIGIWFGKERSALEKTTTRGRHLVGVFSLKDYEAETFEVTAWMPKRAVPFFNWINGQGAAKGPLTRIVQAYHPEVDRISSTEADKMRKEGKEITDEEIEKHNANLATVASVYRGPRLRIHEVMIEGPLEEAWPPPSHRSLVGTTTRARQVDIPEALTRFATKAFRRPVSREEISHYIAFVDRLVSEGETYPNALKSGFSALLTSPDFLYLDEGNADESDELTPFQLASRLSYFLWSSMPDAELIEAAANGKSLTRNAHLEKQFERMLDDPRSAAISKHFTEAWLRLRKLGEMPPDPAMNKAYFEDRLETAMKEETSRFFTYLLEENKSILNFVDSDFSFLNAALAKHYGIPGVEGDFRKVSLPAESQRGGLLGHGSILTLTSNGVETQPVVRGVWILENLLGTPPNNPPPPDVDPLEPDTRGVTTIRQLMEKHRENSTCYECHRKIDPLGLGMENFDHVGAWRALYQKNSVIDVTGEMPDGTAFEGIDGIREYIKARPDQFTHCLAEKLLTYGVGRKLTFLDRDDIELIVKEMPKHDYGFRELVHQIVATKSFQTK